MKIFLIQCDDEGIPVNDMAANVIEAVRYHHWLRHFFTDWDYDYVLLKNDDSFIDKKTGKLYTSNPQYIPVGNIEFIEKFIFMATGKTPKPINIPKKLMTPEFLGRTADFVKFSDINSSISLNGNKFVKSIDKIKGASGMTDTLDISFVYGERNVIGAPEDSYSQKFFVSDIIPISSEWRCFIFNNELIDVRHYIGEFDNIPSKAVIKEMIASYTNSPPAYTLDVGVTNYDRTVILEVHNFWSCGLYGFEASEKLLKMISQSFVWEMKKCQ